MACGPNIITEPDEDSENLSRTNLLDFVKCFGIGAVHKKTSHGSGTGQSIAESSSSVACLERGCRENLANSFDIVFFDCREK